MAISQKISTEFGPSGWSFWLTDLKRLNGWSQDTLSCYVPYNFPGPDPDRIEELQVLLSHKSPGWWERVPAGSNNKCLSGRIRNQTLQILAGPTASNGKSTLFNLVSQAFVQTIIAICLLHTSLRRVRKPTYPDFRHHIHWGCIEASRSKSTFPNPDFCKTGAFGAGLITLDGPTAVFKLAVIDLNQSWVWPGSDLGLTWVCLPYFRFNHLVVAW